MVFLTHYGLERHAKQKHKENYDQIMGEIEKIQKEWERREKERSRLREKALIAKARHESYAQSALNYAQKGGKLILPDGLLAVCVHSLRKFQLRPPSVQNVSKPVKSATF
jgi:hypothetical protein